MPSETLQIGLFIDSWAGWAFAYELLRKKIKPQIFFLNRPGAPTDSAVYLGNGDPLDRVQKVMGNEIAGEMWKISEANLGYVRDRVEDFTIFFDQKGLLRNEDKTTERALIFSNERYVERVRRLLDREGVVVTEVKEFPKLEVVKPFQIKVGASPNQQEVSVFLTVSESPSGLPFLADKIIPVTLTTLSGESKELTFSIALFNKGADFVLNGTKTWFGSFRNLYADKAVGIQTVPDPKTEEGVRAFFGSMGWVSPTDTLTPFLSVESISCDGLPVAGEMPEMPGVWAFSGFGGRTANFIFAVAAYWADEFLNGGSYDRLRLFSTKRFL